MKRRLIAAATAVLLAVLGGALLLSYVGAADERALAGMQATPVLVATARIPAGTSGNDLAKLVTVRQLPAIAVAPGTTATLADLRELVTTTQLEAGEQLLLSRFADPEVLAKAKGLVVPQGLHQVSLQLEPQRALNGKLAPGSTVGVFISLTKPTTSTGLTLHQVLVTAVQGAPVTATEGDDAAAQPAGPLTVTLAVDAATASKIVFGAEHGTIWLSAEPAEAPTDRAPITTEENLYP